MGGGGVVQICHIVTHQNVYTEPAPAVSFLTRISSFHFGDAAFPPAPADLLTDAEFAATPVPPAGKATGKIGIRLERGIDADLFLLRFEGQIYQPMRSMGNGGVEDELRGTFGGDVWWGYEVWLPPPAGRFDLAAQLRLRIKGRFARRRQLSVTPIVLGFAGQRFEDHYALGLTVLQREPTYLIDTALRQRL